MKNVIEAGGCTLIYRGRTISVTEPVFTAVAKANDQFPLPVRVVLRLINVDQALLLRRAD